MEFLRNRKTSQRKLLSLSLASCARADALHASRSILFIIAYFLLVPLLVLRVGRKSSRTLVLIRPAIFVTIRIATYVIRAIQATGNEGEGLFVAEQVSLIDSSVQSCRLSSRVLLLGSIDLPLVRFLPTPRALFDPRQVQPLS